MPHAPNSRELWALIAERLKERAEILHWLRNTAHREDWQAKLKHALSANEKEIDRLFQTEPDDRTLPRY